MAREEKRTLTPRLRFPEFREGEGWEVRPIGHYLTESRTLGSNGRVAKKLTVKLWGKGVTEKAEALRGSENTQYYRRSAGQFIYSKLDFLNQAFGIVPSSLDGYESTADLPCFDVADSLNSKFLLEYVQRECFYKTNGDIADGGRKAKRIQVESFLSFPIAVPASIAEQQKIADCLTSLDELIAAQGRKVNALKAYKKGLMLQFFPREGETIPRLRFPEFRDGPQWEERQISACFSQIRNGFVGTATPFYVSDGVPYLQGKNVKSGRIDPTALVTISKAFHDKQTKSQLRSDDIIMVQSGHVGECAVVGEEYAGANCHALLVMTPRERQYSPFFVHCFGSDYGRGRIAQITTGNTIKHILASDIKALVISVPDFDEQLRVGEFFDALDSRIAAETEKLTALKTHKKGMIQQLFPVAGE